MANASCNVVFFALLLRLTYCLGRVNDETPISKVIALLTDLKAEVEKEGASEASNYNKFSCFCKDSTMSKSGSITENRDLINELSATIEEKTASKALKSTELTEEKAKKEENSASLKASVRQFESDEAEYTAAEADLSKAVSSLDKAIKSMLDAKPTFIQVSHELESSLRTATTFKIAAGAPVRKTFGALVQNHAAVDPTDPEYKYHSHGIIEQLKELSEQFSAKLKEVQTEWGITEKAHSDEKASLEAKLEENDATILSTTEAIDELTTQIAESRGSLVSTENLLKDAELYLKDLTALCEARAKDYDQRSSLRAGELDALTKALAVLTEKVEELSAVNKRALLMQTPGATPHVSFVQRDLHSTANRRLSFARRHVALQPPLKVQKVLAMFQDDGSRLKSPVLASLAMHIAADPFGKVKKMIQDLVERLLAESTAEATKKGFCDTELGKAEKDRDFRLADVKKIDAELASLLAKESALEEEMDELSSSMEEARGALNESGILRESEKDANLKTLADAKEGLAAVTQALEILKAFYKQAAKANVLLQASPVDEDTSGPGFDAAYTGKQEASKGIIGLLEVIKSDFERTISKTEAAEKEAAADFVKLDRSSKVDIGGKETKTALDGEDLATTKNSITQGMADLKSNMDLLDSALKEIEALKPACIDMTMPYKERVQKRDEEIASLKSALCILDTDGIEEECSKAR